MQVLRCPVCLEAFSASSSYAVYTCHLRIHCESALYKEIEKICGACYKLFRTTGDWSEHREREHPEGNIAQEGKKVMCHICGIDVPER